MIVEKFLESLRIVIVLSVFYASVYCETTSVSVPCHKDESATRRQHKN